MKIFLSADPKFRNDRLIYDVLMTLKPSWVVTLGLAPTERVGLMYSKRNGAGYSSYPLARYKVRGYASPDLRRRTLFVENPDIGLAVFMGMGEVAMTFYRECESRGIRCFVVKGFVDKNEIVLSHLRVFERGVRGKA